MVKKIQINLSNRLHYTLILIGILIVGAWVVVAYGGAYGDPAIMGHTADEIDGLSGGGTSFGDWETKNEGQVYQATSDGFVVVSFVCVVSDCISGRVYGNTDSNNPPITSRIIVLSYKGGYDRSFTMPVKEGDYWRITRNDVNLATTVWWISTGGGSGGGGFPAPIYDSGWFDLDPSQTVTLNHNIGGDTSDYFLDLRFKQIGGNGIHNAGIGMDSYPWGVGSDTRGSYWRELTSTSVKVYQSGALSVIDQAQLRIWKY